MDELNKPSTSDGLSQSDVAPKKPKLSEKWDEMVFPKSSIAVEARSSRSATTVLRTGNSRMKKKPQNMVCLLRGSDTFGIRQRQFSKLSKNYVQSYQARFKEIEDLPANLHKIFEIVEEEVDLKDKELDKCLVRIYDLLLEDSKASLVANEIFYSGGVELIADMLIRAFYDASPTVELDGQIKVVAKEDIRIVKCMLQIVYLSAQAAPIGLAHLCEKPQLMHFLFSLLAENEKRMFTDATLFLEEMLLSEPRKPVIDMKKIPCLPAVLEKDLTHQQESHLYHILASAISVNDSLLTVDTSLQEHDKWLMNNSRTKLNKENQEYLISFKHFLEKLFRLSCHPLRFELRSSIINDLFRGLNVDIVADNNLAELYSRLIEENPDSPLYQANLYCEKSVRADAFLLLSMLLTGKCRDQMQQNVLDYSLIQGLEKTVDSVVWKSLNNEHFPDHVHGEYAECGPETTVKIQYLRLIYSISDHHLHRYLLLNQEELNEIRQTAETHKVSLFKDFDTLDSSKCCAKDTGLLVQVIENLKKESSNSYVRFWMTRALEAFLRGTVCKVDQLFLIKKGLLEELFRVLLSKDRASSEVIQGHFDLLSSLMKDNFQAFEKFSKIVDCHSQFQKLCRMIDDNLVDSNMFVRCVILSIYCFNKSLGNDDEKRRGIIEECRILKHYANLERRVQAIFRLIGLLTVKTLSQENVSCLNTSIIILLVARLNGELPKYLSAILGNNDDVAHSGQEILENLKELLEFWLEHYSHPFKENDIKSLEESTGFPFCGWKKLTEELISSDASSPHAIQHYLLPPPTPTYALKATLVPSCTRTN